MDPVRIAALYPISNSGSGSFNSAVPTITMQRQSSSSSNRRAMVRGLSSSSSMYSEYTNDDDDENENRYDDDADIEDFEDSDDGMMMLIDNAYNNNDYDDMNGMRWLPPIALPGPFVVLQGSAGDGMANTIDSRPSLPLSTSQNSGSRSRPATAINDPTINLVNVTAHDGTSSSSSFQHMSSAPSPPLGRLATSTANNPFAGRGVIRNMGTTNTTTTTVPATNSTAADHHRSYVVVTDNDPREDDNEEDDNSSSSSSNSSTSHWQHVAMSAADVEAIAKWRDDCLQAETQQHEDWRESQQQQQQQQVSLDHIMMSRDTSTTTASSSSSSCWWQPDHNHQVAILRDIPTKLNNGSVLRTVIGSLAPGTTLIARDIVHLDSQTFQRLSVLPERMLGNDENGNSTDTNAVHRLVYARGQKGVIQLVQVETPEGRAGYAVLSLDGYSLLAPGLPQHYIDPNLWLWRVSCPAGAFVREGLDLSTQHRDTIPYGSLVRVTRRCINNQGLSRLKTHGTVPDSAMGEQQPQESPHMRIRSSSSSSSSNDGSDERPIEGWCSELLNPLSGQRGVIVQPLPFPVPAIYRVVFPDGAVVRRDVELSSPQVGEIPCGSEVEVVARAFSEHPVDKCIERLQLAGGAGWISVRLNRMPPRDDMVVECVGVDSDFDPENPGLYHLEAQKAVRAQQQEAAAMQLSQVDLSSVDEDDISDDDMDGTGRARVQHRNTNGSTPTSSESHCVICLTSERNATIVHGSTGHVVCCLVCARILKARGDKCPICRSNIDMVIQHFYA